MEYYSAIEKNEIMQFAAIWIDLEIIILSEVIQKEKNKYHMISYIIWYQKYDKIIKMMKNVTNIIRYHWNLKYDTNEHIYET